MLGYEKGHVGQPRGVSPTNAEKLSLPDIVHRFKSYTTNLYSRGVKEKGWQRYPGRLWHRNYYEHVIRNDDALAKLREYITNNPFNWAEDEENPANLGRHKRRRNRPWL